MFESNGRSLWVGASEQFRTLKEAIAASGSGDTIFVRAGEYRNDWATISHDLRIVGVDGMAHLVSDQLITNRKAILITQADVVIENVEFSGARVNEFNGAGIRYEGGDLTLRNTFFHNNQNGVLGANDPNGHVLIENSEFSYNGTGNGQTHGIYFGKLANLTVRGSYVHDTIVGSHIKSRATETLVENNRLIDGENGTAGYSVDLPNGGNSIIRSNIIDQGGHGVNQTIINFGGETTTPTGWLLMEGNQVNNARATSIAVFNRTDLDVTVRSNSFSAVDKLIEGKGTIENNVSSWVASQGSHKFVGTGNLDIVDYSGAPAGIDLDLETGFRNGGFRGRDTLSSIDIVTGSASADKMAGDSYANWLTGGGGDDKILGRQGDDVLQGNAGRDYLAGGIGNDIARGGPDNDILDGQAGNDILYGDLGDDLVAGNEGDDFLQGTAGNDTVAGGSGNDSIRGGSENDVLRGEDGNDVIAGDRGDDALIGGGHADRFLFMPGSGRDTIQDFNQGSGQFNPGEGDRIVVAPGMAWSVGQDQGFARIDFGNGEGVTLLGVTEAQFDRGWVVLG